MAFCNSCGATLNPGMRFCNKCGAPQVAQCACIRGATAHGLPATAMAAAPPPSTGGSSALKIILIVVAVIVGIGILGRGHIQLLRLSRGQERRMSRQQGDNVKVETPFGHVRDVQRSGAGCQGPGRRYLSRSGSAEERSILGDHWAHPYRDGHFREQATRSTKCAHSTKRSSPTPR